MKKCNNNGFLASKCSTWNWTGWADAMQNHWSPWQRKRSFHPPTNARTEGGPTACSGCRSASSAPSHPSASADAAGSTLWSSAAGSYPAPGGSLPPGTEDPNRTSSTIHRKGPAASATPPTPPPSPSSAERELATLPEEFLFFSIQFNSIYPLIF